MLATEAQLPSRRTLPECQLRTKRPDGQGVQTARYQGSPSRLQVHSRASGCLVSPAFLPCFKTHTSNALLLIFSFFNVWCPAVAVGYPSPGDTPPRALASRRHAERRWRCAGIAGGHVRSGPTTLLRPTGVQPPQNKGRRPPRPYLCAASPRATVSVWSGTARHGPE